MKPLLLAALMVAACGPGAGFYELSPGASSLEARLAGIGALCDGGGDCAAGLACTNLLYADHPECELPWPREERCPAGTSHMLSATAEPGSTVSLDDLKYTGSFCTLDCDSDADCRNGQRCLPAKPRGICSRLQPTS